MLLMNRRKFLGLVLTVATGSLAYKGLFSNSQKDQAGDIHEHMYNYGLHLMGAKFENIASNQLEQLEAILMSRDWREVHTEVDFYKRVGEIIRGEFLSNKVVEIDGWIITEFEKDMALYALLVKRERGISTTEAEATFETAKFSDVVNVKNWGPKSTCVGMGFNQQSDGHSSHWFAIDSYNGRLTIYIGNKAVPTTKGTDVLTTKNEGQLLDEIISTPRQLDVVVYDAARNIKQKIGIFDILDRSSPVINSNGKELQYFGKVEGWGPKALSLTQLTGDKKTPLWIKSRCAPRDTVIYIGETPLVTTVSSTLITGHYSEH